VVGTESLSSWGVSSVHLRQAVYMRAVVLCGGYLSLSVALCLYRICAEYCIRSFHL
jgi:hypothetical protein